MLKEEKARTAAQEEVLREYVAQIKDLQVQLTKAKTDAEKAAYAKVAREIAPLKEEVDMYRSLIKGWSKGRKLVKRLTRDPYDY
jgi:phage host-nuclease inhibitor protein Gam